ncbi:MAG: zinc-binding dehydrogenase, partial [Synergistaceae bacterium]|nr:zinc-binding dehydrogenase [Synergistaceae bacterium]
MKKFAALGGGKTGWLDKKAPVCPPRGAVLRPLAVAPCTTDVHTVSGTRKTMLGHESVGEILEAGPLVRDFRPGDVVIVPSITPDWSDTYSQDGTGTHCWGQLFGGRDVLNTCFAEKYAVSDADGNLALLPEGMTPEEGAMLSDMAATGFTAADSAGITFGDTVAVIGIGPVGLMSVAASVLRGASYVYAVGSRRACVRAAKNYGASEIVSYKDGNITDQILALNKGRPVDKVIICGGNVSSYSEALKLVRNGGTVVNAAFIRDAENITLPLEAFGGGIANKRIIGVATSGGRAYMERLARMVTSGRLDVKPLITHRFNGLDKIEEALNLMREKPDDLIKPVV